MLSATRRQFLGQIGHGMLAASLGTTLAGAFAAPAVAARRRARALPDDLEELIARMQQSAAADLQPWLVERLRAGTRLEMLAAAGALANARTFGGSDYEGYHAFMALRPAFAMTTRMPKGLEPLPLLKVLWRSSARMQAAGSGRAAPMPAAADAGADQQPLRELVRARDLDGAERTFGRQCAADVGAAWRELQPLVQDEMNVHRIVLAWRAWDMLALAGPQQANALLRQLLRFCVDVERQRVARKDPEPAVRTDLPRILEQHGLLAKTPGDKVPDDPWVDELARVVFGADRAQAADAVAAALAAGYAPAAVGEAIALGANRLLLHDPGKERVHGASVGVHAADAANAWRHVASALPAASQLSSLVAAAYHTAGQSGNVAREPYAFADELARLADPAPEALLRAAAAAIEQRDQRAACAAVQRYGELGHAPAAVFDLLLRYAVSEDGALHAEKYFHTVSEEFAAARPAFRWRYVVALARVTASEYGQPAPGVAAARELLRS